MYRFIEKTINIQENELPRTLFSWLIKFLHKSGFIIGWTIITAMFITKFSIRALPILFLIPALLNISGMAIFSLLGNRFSQKNLLAACCFTASTMLLVAGLLAHHTLLFFTLSLLIFGLIIPQIGIFLSAYLEDFFSPFEVVRVAPVIESAETIGGIFAGLIIASLSQFVPPYKFFYLWAFLILLINCAVLFLEPKHSEPDHKKNTHPTWKKVQHSFEEIKKIPFFKILIYLFLLHWIVAHLVEFQYTSVVDASTHGIEGEKREESLAHGLASFHTLFHSSALVVQLFATSRILKKFGTAASFIIHSIVTLLSAGALFFGFGSFATILAKNNFEISGIIQKNGYEASYYALCPEKKQIVREVFEALVVPLGTILGTTIVLFVQWFFLENHVNISIQLVLFSISILMVILSVRTQNQYSNLVKNNVLKNNPGQLKRHAIEILSQKGHSAGFEVLQRALNQKKQRNDIRIKILETFGNMGDIRSIPTILRFIHSKKKSVALAALRSLEIFPLLEEKTRQLAFSRYRIVEDLQKLFLKSRDETVQISIVKILSRFRDPEMVPFLLKVIHDSPPSLQATGIKACAVFKDEGIGFYLEPYLHSSKSEVKAQAMIALWQFPNYRPRLRRLLEAMITSNQKDELICACSVFGEIGDLEDKNSLIPFMGDADPEIRLWASHSLLKLGYSKAAPCLAHLLLEENSVLFPKIDNLILELPRHQKAYFKDLLSRIRADSRNNLQNLKLTPPIPAISKHNL